MKNILAMIFSRANYCHCLDIIISSENTISIFARTYQQFINLDNMKRFANKEISEIHIGETLICDRNNNILKMNYNEDNNIIITAYITDDEIQELITQLELLYVTDYTTY